MSENLPTVLKPTGDEQRIDVALTSAIADTLVRMIQEGKSLYPRTGKLVLDMGEGKTVELSRNQVGVWITRNNVIPENGKLLRQVLDEAREEKRIADDRKEQADIIATAQTALGELVNLPTKNGKMITRKFKVSKKGKASEYGRIETEIQGHNPKLVEVKAKALMFGLERLRPAEYALKTKTENTHMIFSLADLRKAKDERDLRFATI